MVYDAANFLDVGGVALAEDEGDGGSSIVLGKVGSASVTRAVGSTKVLTSQLIVYGTPPGTMS